MFALTTSPSNRQSRQPLTRGGSRMIHRVLQARTKAPWPTRFLRRVRRPVAPNAAYRRIVLVRHGHSAHTASPGWIDASGVERWREAYDAAGILDDSNPPAPLVAAAARADCVLTSDLKRALASAERLAPGRAARVSPLFREMYLEIPRW